MTNPVCLSPLKFYDKIAKQSHRKTYAYGHISPLIVKLHSIPSFQFVLKQNSNLSSAYLRDKDDKRVTADISQSLKEGSLSVSLYDDRYYVVVFRGIFPIAEVIYEGYYYLELIFENGDSYYSEMFCFTNSVDDCLEIEYWNSTNNFYIKDGIIAFPEGFHFKLLLKTEIGKPEYNFEEEGTKRLGYNFIESQVSKKIYKFNAVVPEYICDALRLIRLCDNKIIRSKGDEFEAISFDMEVEWQTQGDLASVNCEFETDNIIANLGGFIPDKKGGDYNSDYNNDYDIE